jgi:hypothetical protein
MTLSSFTLWLHGCGEALVNRCAAAIQGRRMRRAKALLPKAALENAAFWRALYLARTARLQREREAREARRGAQRAPASALPPAPEISKTEVLAAIARSRASREARLQARRERR